MNWIDLRSDTCSVPDEEMRSAMHRAQVGNESWGEDPTVNRLVETACALVGKQAGLFMASGTMSNLVALLTYAEQYPAGSEIIAPEYAHTYWYEAAGVSRLAGFSVRTVDCSGEFMPPALVEAAVRPAGDHMPHSALVWVENSYMLGGGVAVPLARMRELQELAHRHGMCVHLDGARLFNAAHALGVSPGEVAQYADTVQFCFSKGLGAPFGSILCGSGAFIQRARHNRTMVGGGMRQAGIMAAAALVGLSRAAAQISRDHENAQLLARGLNGLFPGGVDLERTQTNIVLFYPERVGQKGGEFCAFLKEHGVLALTVPAAGGSACRFVLYGGVSRQDVQTVLDTAALLRRN